jgi:hypothetical protein
MLFLKTLNPGGIQTRVPEGDAMSTAPLRQGFIMIILHFQKKTKVIV